MSEENRVVSETAVGDNDRTVNVRMPDSIPAASEEVEEEDRTVNIRVEKLLNDPRMQAMQAQAQSSPAAGITQGADVSSHVQGVEETATTSGTAKTATLIAGFLIAGGLLGWLGDKALTNNGIPWGLIVGLIVGAVVSAVFAMRKSA